MNLSSTVYALTGFGDLAVLLPLSTVVLVWLWRARSTREALRWAIAVALCGGGIAVLKIYFYACPPAVDLQSPSGHTGLSTLVYGAVALFAMEDAKRWRRWAVAAAGSALVLAIAATRYMLGAHSLAEIALGLAIGIATLAIFRGRGALPRAAAASPKPLLFTAVLLVAILDGQQLHAEEMLHAISTYLWAGGAACG
jgi:membrane-associated phospholipid phosphatase